MSLLMPLDPALPVVVQVEASPDLASITSTETSCTPGWETPSVPVYQPGVRIRN